MKWYWRIYQTNRIGSQTNNCLSVTYRSCTAHNFQRGFLENPRANCILHKNLDIFRIIVIGHFIVQNRSEDEIQWSKWIVNFPAKRNRNRFAEPTSVRIWIGIFRRFQNLRIGIGMVYVRWEVFANYSQIPEIYIYSQKKI